MWYADIKATDYLKGALKIDEYVTHNRTLADINEGFHDMHVSQLVYPGGGKKLSLRLGWKLHSLHC